MRRDTQEQMHVIGPHVALKNFYVLPLTDLLNLLSHLLSDFARSTGLRYFVQKTK